LLLAQKFVDQTKRESEAEAAEIVGRAEERARAVLSQAEERARQMSTEAEQRLRDEVARLEAMRTRLAADVKAMHEQFEDQRAKMRASLTEALKWVEERAPGTPPRAEEGRAQLDETRASASQSTVRRSPGGGEGASRVPGGPATIAGSAAAASSPRPGGAAGTRPSAGAGGSEGQERPPTGAVPGTPEPERTHAPVGASVASLGGGLFDAGRSADNGAEGTRRPQ
jgi:hypothetical protein